MALIDLIKGATFFGDIIDYDWKGKFLVVEVGKDTDDPHRRIIHWDNIEDVSASEEEMRK